MRPRQFHGTSSSSIVHSTSTTETLLSTSISYTVLDIRRPPTFEASALEAPLGTITNHRGSAASQDPPGTITTNPDPLQESLRSLPPSHTLPSAYSKVSSCHFRQLSSHSASISCYYLGTVDRPHFSLTISSCFFSDWYFVRYLITIDYVAQILPLLSLQISSFCLQLSTDYSSRTSLSLNLIWDTPEEALTLGLQRSTLHAPHTDLYQLSLVKTESFVSEQYHKVLSCSHGVSRCTSFGLASELSRPIAVRLLSCAS